MPDNCVAVDASADKKYSGRDNSMCGRYDLNALAQELAARVNVSRSGVTENASDASLSTPEGATLHSNVNSEWRPRYNMAPGQHNPVVLRDAGGHNHLELMQWGL